MKVFQWLIDALLIAVLFIIIYKVYNNYYGTPPPEWKNPFQSLAWQKFNSIEFPTQDYSITINQNTIDETVGFLGLNKLFYSLKRAIKDIPKERKLLYI